MVNLQERDGEQRLAEIQKQSSPNLVELVFLPMYGVKGKDREAFATEIILYGRKLYEQGKMSLDLLGAIFVICNKIVSKDVLEAIWKEISMLKVFQYAEDVGKRKGLEEGRIETLKEMILALLEVKFQEEGALLYPEIAKVSDLSQLIVLKEVAKQTKDLAKVKEILAKFNGAK